MKVKNLNEAYESPNIDQPSFVEDELERLYGPIRKMINDDHIDIIKDVIINEIEITNCNMNDILHSLLCYQYQFQLH